MRGQRVSARAMIRPAVSDIRSCGVMRNVPTFRRNRLPEFSGRVFPPYVNKSLASLHDVMSWKIHETLSVLGLGDLCVVSGMEEGQRLSRIQGTASFGRYVEKSALI